MQSNGLPSDECVPYTAGTERKGKCPSKCVDGSNLVLHKVKAVRTYRTTDDAKIDILTNGPVQTGFAVYEDFMLYESGIYKHTDGMLLGAHTVKVLGWGVENGV